MTGKQYAKSDRLDLGFAPNADYSLTAQPGKGGLEEFSRNAGKSGSYGQYSHFEGNQDATHGKHLLGGGGDSGAQGGGG